TLITISLPFCLSGPPRSLHCFPTRRSSDLAVSVISLRYHIVSIAAAFLALAVGVVLGSTALSGSLLSGLADERSQLADRVSDLRSEEHTSELQSRFDLVCRLLLEKNEKLEG